MVDKRILTRAQADAGLTIAEDEDVVLLCKGNEVVGHYSAKGVTIAEIRKDADAYLSKSHVAN